MEPVVFLNDELVPLSRAKVSVLDYGFLFGYGIFETMRSYNGKIFKLDRHLDRLSGAARMLGIPVEMAKWQRAVQNVLQANKLSGARVRLVLTVGEGSLSPDLRSCVKPAIVGLAAPYHPPSQETYSGGYKVIISSIRRNSQSPLPGMKTSNFLESLLARQEAKNAGVDDALLLNDKGMLVEASSSNVFVVNRNNLNTSPLGSGLLPGITRGVILELASSLNIPAGELDIQSDELLKADEAFISNSMIEIMPVTKVNGLTIASGQPGPITRQLMAAYQDLVQKETG